MAKHEKPLLKGTKMKGRYVSYSKLLSDAWDRVLEKHPDLLKPKPPIIKPYTLATNDETDG